MFKIFHTIYVWCEMIIFVTYRYFSIQFSYEYDFEECNNNNVSTRVAKVIEYRSSFCDGMRNVHLHSFVVVSCI